jgi:hypothetical protein
VLDIVQVIVKLIIVVWIHVGVEDVLMDVDMLVNIRDLIITPLNVLVLLV